MECLKNSFEALGTTIFFESTTENFTACFQALELEAERLEQKFSRFRSHSELGELNQRLNEWVPLDAEFLKLLKWADNFKRITNGYFDIGVHQALSHWGYDEQYRLKSSVEVGDFVPTVIEFKEAAVRLNAPIDFGAFGKGYFLDQAATILADLGCRHYLLNAGGDLRVVCDDAAPSWRLYLEDPRIKGRVIGEYDCREGLLCGSSPLQRQWGDFHHLVDPHTMSPSQHMGAVFVQGQANSMQADALCTTLFVMGFHEAQQWWALNQARFAPLAVMLLSQHGKIWRSSGFQVDLFTS